MLTKGFFKKGIALALALGMLFPGNMSVSAAEKKGEARNNVTKKHKEESEEAEEIIEPEPTPEPIRGVVPGRLLAANGNGRFSETMSFSLPKLSCEPYEDIVSFSLKSWDTTGRDRNDWKNAAITLLQNGNDCTVSMSNLLDYENYSVVIRYEQTYFFEVEKTGTRIGADGSVETYTYIVIESKTITGTLSGSVTTEQDTYIRNAYDLKEKVHKYPSLTLAGYIDCQGLQSDIDGKSRGSWLVSGDISQVSIAGNGNTIRRQQDGFIFHIYDGASLTLRHATLEAYSGSIIKTKTEGGEYEVSNPSGTAAGSAIEVGFDSAYDEHDTSSGNLLLQDSVVMARNSAVTVRCGSVSVMNSLLYGMGEKDEFSYANFEDYIGVGILTMNSGKAHADVKVTGSSLYGRYNGMLLQGDASGDVSGCRARGDCGDAFDFRASGTLDIKNCQIYGVKGIDVFDDATYAAVWKALNGNSFDRSAYSAIIGKKGTVTVSDTSMFLNTGAFRGDAEANSFGIQNRGNLIIGENVKISTIHSGAWNTVASENRAFCCGIYNVSVLELPADIYIKSDDNGISENRNIGAIRNLVSIKGGSTEYAAAVEHAVTGNGYLYDLLDSGNNSVLTLKGGMINAGDTGIEAPFGSVYLEPELTLSVSGKLCGILIGKNGPDNIFGKDAGGAYLSTGGDGKNSIRSSLQGSAVIIRESGQAELTGKDTELSNDSGPCGTGIKNGGMLLLKNAVIKAQKAGIRNLETGKTYIGDELDEKGDRVSISEAVYGIRNDGEVYYYRNVVIENCLKAGVWQNGIFYMLPGAKVSPENAIYLTSKGEGEDAVKSTVRILYEEQYEDQLESIEATFNTAAGDREPGRVMAALYSADGKTDYSAETYRKTESKEKLRISELLTGFSLSFSEVKDHKAALRCGLGKYERTEEKKADLQPEDGEATNGRTGTLVLSCLLHGKYDADFPVRREEIKAETPDSTPFYWREPTEFQTAPVTEKDDRCHIFFKGKDVTAGLKQTGYRDREGEEYGSRVYDTDRIIRIYSEDHVFYGIWDTDFTMIFDGNGQTNDAENYSKEHVDGEFVFDGNTGPDGKSDEYFIKSITRKRFDYETLSDRTYLHQTSFQGWSFDKDASYKDDGVYCKGDALHGPEELATDETEQSIYPNYKALAFYVYALEKDQVTFDDGKADVRIYAVWDEFPVITAQDSSFYADELSDQEKVMEKLLSEDTVTVTDHEDGVIGREYIKVYTDPVKKIFSLDELKKMGDLGSVSVYYSVTDKNDTDLERFKQNTSVTQAKIYVMSEDAEDTADEIPQSAKNGNGGTSTDTFYSAPVYVRAIGKDDAETLEENSVWKEESFRKLLGRALQDTEEVSSEKWVFTGDDIKKSKEMLYEQNADPVTWRNTFIDRRVEDVKEADNDRNKPLIVEEGLSSLRLTWDIKSETDRAEITLSQWGKSEKRTIKRETNQKMASGTLFNELTADSDYLITAEFYYRDKKVLTLKETAHTKKLDKPVFSVYRNDTGEKAELRLSFEKDSNAEKYVIERRCIKGKDTYDWTVIEEIDEFTEKENGERYMDSDVIRYDTEISEEGVYRYRIKAFGSRIGKEDMAEDSGYSDECETGFLKKPVIEATESGCRSIRVILKESTQADFVRIYYLSTGGSLRYTDVEPDGENSGIVSEKMADDTIYGITAEAHIISPEGGKEYTGLKSDTVTEKTKKLISPALLTKKQKDIYTGDGIRLQFKYDENAIGYQVKEDILYPVKQEGAFEEIQLCSVGTGVLEYNKIGGDSRVSEYTVRAVYKTLDGKTFYKGSKKVRAAYIRTQAASGNTISRGDRSDERFTTDNNASCYLVMTETKDQTEEIYVPRENAGLYVYSPERDRQVTQVKTVLMYEGVEYRAL